MLYNNVIANIAALYAQVITDDVVYIVLTSLYNVALSPKLAGRFRIVITKKLLDYFLRQDDIGVRFQAKFCMGCLWLVLSKSELNQVSICSKEADMLARCLRGYDAFFGGYANLIKTIGNLALFPKNRQVFFDTGIVSTLTVVAVNMPSVSNEIFYTLLNMISTLDSSSDSIKALLTSDHSFMKLIRSSSKDVCKGLQLILSASHCENPGMSIGQLDYNYEATW